MRPRTALRAALAAVAVVVSAVVLAGCNGLPTPVPSATALPEGIRASLVVTDQNELALEVDNATEEAVDISRVRLRSPAIGSILVGSTTTDVPAHSTQRVRVPAPHLDCTASAAVEPTATISFTWGAASGVAAITLDGARGAVQQLLASGCRTTAGG